MIRFSKTLSAGVRILTLVTLTQVVGCAYLQHRFGETCKSHAYVRQVLTDYLSRRYDSHAPVRLGIIPFSVPANLATKNPGNPGLEQQLAWKLHQAFLDYNSIPIVEVIPRDDWPGKRDEFFTGNFGALNMARDAGYDLVMVGYVEPVRSTTELIVYSKVIETESGLTLWYGKTTVTTRRRMLQDANSYIGFENSRPDLIYTNDIVDELGRCVAKGVMKEE